MMKSPVVLIGIVEMGGVFARGFLRTGHPVYPVTRETDIDDLARQLPAPELVLVAVAETDLQPVLQNLPTAWRPRLGLLQNELLPGDWQRLICWTASPHLWNLGWALPITFPRR